MNNNLLVLVDGSSYLYRAFHALPPLVNSKNQPTGATYGVLNMLRRLLKDTQPRHAAVVFDAPGKTFRDELYAKYKANRPPMPGELRDQIAPLHQVIEAMGIPLLIVDGVEADDVIGTLARQAECLGWETLISTGDKDFAQLVNDKTTLINTMNNTALDEAGVREKFNVTPSQFIDYLTLIGDSVDNVPGVDKVGPKTAVKWLREYGSLDAIMQNADAIKGKVGENLRAALPRLPLSRTLVTIKTDVKLKQTPRDLIMQEGDRAVLLELLSTLEFKSWLKELSGDTTPPSPAQLYETILTQAQFSQWIKRLEKADMFSFDSETTSLDVVSARVVGVSFAVDLDKAAYVPFGHDYPDAPTQLSEATVLGTLKPLLEDPNKGKLGHNLKYDMSVLVNHDIALQGIRHDTMLESYVVDSAASRHDMDTLAQKKLDYQTIRYTDVAGKGAKQITFNQVPLEKAAPYAAEDAHVCLRLHEAFWPTLCENERLQAVYTDIECPLIPVLSSMERTGVLLDSDLLAKQSEELSGQLALLQESAYTVVGEEFNLDSPKQLQAILYEKMHLPILAKTPKGQPSTAESVLSELAKDHELAQIILDYRSLNKLKSTYTDRLPAQVSAITGRVHTSYHQAVTATGRLSSSDPNLQNIPARKPEGRRIRQAFIAPKGCVLLACDYSQIELRIMAHLSEDAGLLQAFADEKDIHSATAAEIYGVDLNAVSSEQRRSAKVINFGLIYGMSAFGLAKQLGISRREAEQAMAIYFARYPGVKTFMDNIRVQAGEQGFVETLLGRRLYLYDIRSNNHARKMAAERAAINAPMQGTAADIIKRAMIDCHQLFSRDMPDVRMIMQVHDELVFEVPKAKADNVAAIVNERMSGALELKVPLRVHVGMGQNWDEAH